MVYYGPPNIFFYLIIPLLLIPLIMFVGDAITTWRPGSAYNLYWSLWDPLFHAILALLIVSPLIQRKSTHQTRKAMVITVLVAVLIDLDHVVAAGSFSLRYHRSAWQAASYP